METLDPKGKARGRVTARHIEAGRPWSSMNRNVVEPMVLQFGKAEELVWSYQHLMSILRFLKTL